MTMNRKLYMLRYQRKWRKAHPAYSSMRVKEWINANPGFSSYAAAKQRCMNPKHKYWPYYGGRGIEFKYKSFQALKKDIGLRPAGYTLDRIDNDGNYESGNCRWVTRSEQAVNRRPKSYGRNNGYTKGRRIF